MQRAHSWIDENDEPVIVGPMTAEEYFAEALRAMDRPRDARKAELIDGVLIIFPAPLDIHERLYMFLVRLIAEYVERLDLGEVRGSRSAVQLAEDQVYLPDILFISQDRMNLFERHGVMGAPDLVVEILSKSTARYDRGPKLRAYERTGVREVWLIDPNGPQGLEIHQRQGLRLQPVMPEKGEIRSIALPGFRLRLEWLWPEGRFIPVRDALESMLS
jgi:Uma2 family endonuclease